MSEQPTSSNVVSMADYLAEREEAQKHAEPRLENNDELYLHMAGSQMKPYAQVAGSEVEVPRVRELTEAEKQVVAIRNTSRLLTNMTVTRRHAIEEEIA